MSDACLLAEWTTRYKGYQPQLAGSADKQSSLPLVDRYADMLTNRWVYVLLETYDGSSELTVAFELLVDLEGKVFYCERNTKVTPMSPIPERGKPLFDLGPPSRAVMFPMTDDQGRALSVRLLYSTFRLPSATLRKLKTTAYRRELYHRIAPLWEWKKSSADDTTLVSADGYALQPTPLWMEPGNTQSRVWVGGDPFQIAVNRSNVYCHARKQYLDLYEPTSTSARKELSRIMLAQALDAAISRNDPVREKYGRSLDIIRINAALKHDNERRAKLIRAFETAGAALCAALDSPFFQLYQEATLSEEGLDRGDRSEPLVEHLRVLGLTTRMLGQCTSGQALLALWAQDSEPNADHFINRVVLPGQDPTVSHFKAFRWGAKALASVLAEFFSHRVRIRKIAGQKDVAKLLWPLLRLGVGEAFDPIRQITNIERTAEWVKTGNLELQQFKVRASTELHPQRTITFAHAGPEMGPILENWCAEGELRNFGRSKSLLDAKFLGAAVLDTLNLALSVKAAADAQDGDARIEAMFGAGAAGVLLAVSIAEQAAQKGWIALSDSQKVVAKKSFAALRGVAGVYYGIVNMLSASESFRTGDNDRGYALSIASAAEFAAMGAQFYSFFVPVSLAAPWVIVVGGLVAAGAYIAATYLEDDPLDKFLANCEWGSRPYEEADYAPAWANGKVGDWRHDYESQSEMLLRVLTRATARWDLQRWPGIMVSWSLQQPGARLEVEFVAETAGGNKLRELVTFAGSALPHRPPLKVAAAAKTNYVGISDIRRLTATVRLCVAPNTKPETLECLLMEGGVGITSGKETRVS